MPHPTITTERLSSDPLGIRTLIEALTSGATRVGETGGYAHPRQTLQAAQRLEFFRLPGLRKDTTRQAESLPSAPVAGLLAAGSPLGFVLTSDGQRAQITVGSESTAARRLARGIHAHVGGPEPESVDVGELSYDWPSAGCLVGIPSGRPDPENRAGMHSIADLLLDSLRGESFLFALLASPASTEDIRDQISRVEEVVEEIERTHLQLAEQSNVDRSAMRARELLDEALRQLEPGRRGRLWRAAALLCTGDIASTRHGLGIIEGALSPRENDAEETTALIPLRGHLCSSSSDGQSLFSNLLSALQLSTLCFLPTRDRFGFRLTREVDFDVDHASESGGVLLARVLDRGEESGGSVSLPINTLTRHGLITGHTGAGKTNTVKTLLAALSSRGLPFLVLEPAKKEYQRLAARIPNLVVLRAGAPPCPERVPFLINPFAFPRGFPLHTHIDFVKTSFVSAFGLVPPAPYLLETAIVRAYEAKGWDITVGNHPLAHDPLSYPVLNDLLAVIDEVVLEAGYDHEVRQNLQGALKTRIGSLCSGPKGFSLNTPIGLPDDVLFDRPTVIELADFGSDDEKAFVMSLLLTRLFEIRETSESNDAAALQHLLVVEEAHRVLRKVPERSGEESNMRYQSVQTFVNLLAELRAYGQGVLAVEQIPSKLAPEVVKLAGTKVVHRLLPEDDREYVGKAMGLNYEQRVACGQLDVGEAVVHTEGMDGALRARVEYLGNSVSDNSTCTPEDVLPNGTAVRRVRWLIDRAREDALLHDKGVTGMADRLVHAVLAEDEHADNVAGLESAVEGALSRHSQHNSGKDVDRVQRVCRLALREALLRRAAEYGMSLRELETLFGFVPEGLDELGTELRDRLIGLPGIFSTCERCPNPCAWRYEGSRLAADPRFAPEAAEVLTEDGETQRKALSDLTRRAAGRLIGGVSDEQLHGVMWCACAHLLDRWDLSPTASESILAWLED